MKKWSVVVLIGAFLVLVIGSVAYADSGRFAVSAKPISTLGLGVEGTAQILPKLNARLGMNYFPYTYSAEQDDVDYDIDLNLFSGSALLDWHPFAGVFRISAGLVLNGNKLDMEARPKEPVEIGDIEYDPADVGTLSGEIDFNSVAPYVGIGWGNAVGKDKRWGFVCDLGVVFQGSPDVSLAASGPIASDPTFQEELAREEENLQDDLDVFKYYPVISFGISYKF
jgi:hypothetical protein